MVSGHWQNKRLKALFAATLKLKTSKEAAKFFRDLCTIEELEEMGKRWQAASLIQKGKPYRKVAKITGLSTTTVARVAYWLNHGEGGYNLVLKRIK
ncbi:MAG: YerC/YecD family TrpR-related protein [Patescibacteria group bacterium]|jgi:TrpR-related protein YerC/YecD